MAGSAWTQCAVVANASPREHEVQGALDYLQPIIARRLGRRNTVLTCVQLRVLRRTPGRLQQASTGGSIRQRSTNPNLQVRSLGRLGLRSRSHRSSGVSRVS